MGPEGYTPPEVRQEHEKNALGEIAIPWKETSGSPELIDTWWDTEVSKRGFDAQNPIVAEFGYHAIELARNATKYGYDETSGARQEDTAVRLRIEGVKKDGLIVEIEDYGPGFEDATQQISESQGLGFGLEEAVRFSDDFALESRGVLYKKHDEASLERQGKSQVTKGTRITLGKIIPKTNSGEATDTRNNPRTDVAPESGLEQEPNETKQPRVSLAESEQAIATGGSVVTFSHEGNGKNLDNFVQWQEGFFRKHGIEASNNNANAFFRDIYKVVSTGVNNQDGTREVKVRVSMSKKNHSAKVVITGNIPVDLRRLRKGAPATNEHGVVDEPLRNILQSSDTFAIEEDGYRYSKLGTRIDQGKKQKTSEGTKIVFSRSINSQE